MKVDASIPATDPAASSRSATLSTDEKLRIARQFEGLLLQELWRAMQSTIGTGSRSSQQSGFGLSGGGSGPFGPYGAIVDAEWSNWLAGTSLGDLGPGVTDAIMKALDRGDLPITGDGSIAALAAGRTALNTAAGMRSYSTAAATARPASSAPETAIDAGTPEPSPGFNAVSRRVRAHDEAIQSAAHEFDLDPDLLRAMVHQESGGDSRARSSRGALGLMQLMPDTARVVGVQHPFQPTENIGGGARYLRRLLDRFGGDLRKALAAYNAGPGAVERAGGIPAFAETRAYVPRVLELRERYRGVSANSSAAGARPMDATEE